MSRMPSKAFTCSVVSETVTITLRRRNSMAGRGKLFVACSEKDCQYIDANELPCPLNLALFTNEINERMIVE